MSNANSNGVLVRNEILEIKKRAYDKKAAKEARDKAQELRAKREPFDNSSLDAFLANHPFFSKLHEIED